MVQPFGWTLELCLVLWVWIVFLGCAFVVCDRDHVTFDIIYLAAPDSVRRVFAAISCLVVAVTFAWSVLPTWDWIDFLKIKRSATLQVPMRTIYAVNALFLIAVTVRYAWRFLVILRGGTPREDHAVHVGEEG
jgi:C4-dicarboxylate transporter DctQ subunit